MLEAKGIKLEIGGKVLLRGVHLSLQPRSLGCLMGPNGAGKTLLLEIFSGLRPPSSGEVLWKKIPLRGLSPKERAQILAFLPQRSEFFSPFTVEEIVAMGCFARKNCHVKNALRKAGISHLKKRIFTELSEGERKLVLIARVLAQDTDLVILDEPASNLDLANQIRIYRVLSQLSKKKSLLVSEHSIFLGNFCHRIFFIKGGKIVAQGTPKEVLNAENIKRVYGIHPDSIPLPPYPEGRSGKIPQPEPSFEETGLPFSSHHR